MEFPDTHIVIPLETFFNLAKNSAAIAEFMRETYNRAKFSDTESQELFLRMLKMMQHTLEVYTDFSEAIQEHKRQMD